MENGKLKRYKVTNSMRFPNTAIKVLFYAGLVVECASILTIIISLLSGGRALMGAAIILALVSFVWLFASRLISENTFGFANISFTPEKIIFRPTNAPDSKEYKLNWSDVSECGFVKARLSQWVYAADHKLNADERKDFPEHAKKGVMYFNYTAVAWEEFIKFVPEQYKGYMIAQKNARKLK